MIYKRRVREYTAPKIEKAKRDISINSEKIDKKLSFPKMLTGLGLAGTATAIKVFVPVVPFMDYLFISGIGMTIAVLGLGIKLDRVKKGGKFWEHEQRIFSELIRALKK